MHIYYIIIITTFKFLTFQVVVGSNLLSEHI